MEPNPPPKENLSKPNLQNLTSSPREKIDGTEAMESDLYTHNQKEGEPNRTYRTEPPNLT